MNKLLLIGALLLASGCGGGGGRFQPRDAAVDPFGDAGQQQNNCDDQHPCPTGQRCYQMLCIPDNGICQSDDDCQNDTYCDCTGGGGEADMGACMGGVCVPYGDGPRGLFDPNCMGASFTPSQFVAPNVKCKFDSGDPAVLTTPVVADLDGDGKPEIIFSGYPDRFVAIHGATCQPYFDKTYTFGDSSQSELAVADLDGDKVPEIIGIDDGGNVVVFDHQGNLLATAPTPYAFADWSAPIVVDVDNKAPPEIVVGGQVSRYTKGQNTLTVLWTQTTDVPTGGSLTIAADLDGDGKPEVITGTQIFDGITGADKTPAEMKTIAGMGGFPAVGDFNHDKKPDIVVVQQGQVSIFDYANKKFIFGPFTTGDSGGAPTVADFDGDGTPEFGTAGGSNYFVYSMKCDPKNKAPQCDKNSTSGVLWQKQTQDISSGVTSSSVFDFNGDGKAEVVYRDECWLRVYDGTTGKTLFAATVTSVTCTEEVVVADVDNDGHADLVVPSDNIDPSRCNGAPEADTGTPWGQPTSGVLVFQDPMNRWMPSRPIWNQNAYHITNINDDATVPTVEKPNWSTWNNYRQNTEGMFGMPGPKADYTGGVATGLDNTQSDCMTAWTLRANLCNRGTSVTMPGVPGSFYSMDPRNGNPAPICTAMTTGMLNPGECETVSCDWKNPPQDPTDLWFRADDDGTGGAPDPECKPMNDLLYLPQAVCMKIG